MLMATGTKSYEKTWSSRSPRLDEKDTVTMPAAKFQVGVSHFIFLVVFQIQAVD